MGPLGCYGPLTDSLCALLCQQMELNLHHSLESLVGCGQKQSSPASWLSVSKEFLLQEVEWANLLLPFFIWQLAAWDTTQTLSPTFLLPAFSLRQLQMSVQQELSS